MKPRVSGLPSRHRRSRGSERACGPDRLGYRETKDRQPAAPAGRFRSGGIRPGSGSMLGSRFDRKPRAHSRIPVVIVVGRLGALPCRRAGRTSLESARVRLEVWPQRGGRVAWNAPGKEPSENLLQGGIWGRPGGRRGPRSARGVAPASTSSGRRPRSRSSRPRLRPTGSRSRCPPWPVGAAAPPAP
jgi:hypothetical protein